MNERGNPSNERPWCWAEKAVRRLIREALEADPRGLSVSSALSLYDAMTEIASDKQSDTFTCSHAHIASFAGLSVPTSKRLMPRFVEMGIVHVRENFEDGIQTNNTYTLLSHKRRIMVTPRACLAADSSHKRRINQENFSVDTRIEESLDKSSDKYLQETRLNQTQAAQQSPNGDCRERHSVKKISRGGWRRGYLQDELEAIDLYHAVCCSRGFVKVNRYALGLQNALRAELDALKVCHPESWREELRAEFEKAADSLEEGDSAYCAEGGNRLIRILYRE